MPQIKTITSADYHAWDQYILFHPLDGVYLSTPWKQAIEHGYGHETFYLAAFENNAITGVLPLALINPPLGAANLVSLPFCDYGGLLADNNKAASALLDRAVALAREHRAGLEIRSSSASDQFRFPQGFAPATDKCRMLLKLPESSDLLWSGFKSKLRSQIKKPSREGLVARLGQSELLPDFYKVFCRNMRDLGSPVHSIHWINSVIESFSQAAKVCVVYKDNTPAAGGIILMHAQTATVPWASALREYSRLSPNMLLYWTFLKYAADNGFAFFDFGRSTQGEGTFAFKEQWGAKPVPLSWHRLLSNGTTHETVSGKGSLRRASEKIWQNLPLAAANTLGPRLRKYIDR
jgi:FemAB-related protein (PEP-CTERM system-associated)